jgi:polyisoprenoid-binding protein YceI
MRRVLMVAAVVVAAGAVARAGEVSVPLTGDNTKITFVGTKPGGKHNGGFKKVTGSATYDGKDPASLKFTVDIDVDSMYTDTQKLTDHLKSPDFFDAKNNPKAQFVSSKVEKSGDGYKVSGKLTMAGKSNDVSFPATIEASGNSVTLSSSFKINRNDWGISYGKGKIDDDVALKIEVKAKK